MKKLDLSEVASEFEMIDDEYPIFYNRITGEFVRDFGPGFEDEDEEDEYEDKFEGEEWISTPRQYDLNEYKIMTDFIKSETSGHERDLLAVSIQGKGAFRRFKDTLGILGLLEMWYTFKTAAYIEIAREWCDRHNLPYE